MKRFIIYVLGVLFISTAGLFAQDDTSPINMTYEREPIYLGFTFGYNRVLHQVTKPTNDLEKELSFVRITSPVVALSSRPAR